MYDDLIHFVSPRRQHTGTAALRMAGFDDVYLDSQFDNGTDGTVFEYEVIRWATTTVDGDPESVKRAGGLDDPNGYVNVEFQDLGDDKESYRWTNLIVSNRSRDDYSRIIELGKALDRSGAALDRATQEVMVVDQWMRAAAYQSLAGPCDAYFTGSNVHNFRLYVRPDGKVLYLPWDWDSALGMSTSAPLVGTGRLAQVVRLPANLRLFYGHMLDIIDRSFNREYMQRWTEHYGELAGRNFTSHLSYIRWRSEIAERFPRFSIEFSSPLGTLSPVRPWPVEGGAGRCADRLAGSDHPWTLSGRRRGAVADSWQAVSRGVWHPHLHIGGLRLPRQPDRVQAHYHREHRPTTSGAGLPASQRTALSSLR
jgi:hypothetical protein